MKATPFLLVSALALGATACVSGTDKKAITSQPPANQSQVLTGSYVARDVKRAGVITDAPYPVYVLDEQTLRTGGGADLSQALIHSGFRR